VFFVGKNFGSKPDGIVYRPSCERRCSAAHSKVNYFGNHGSIHVDRSQKNVGRLEVAVNNRWNGHKVQKYHALSNVHCDFESQRPVEWIFWIVNIFVQITTRKEFCDNAVRFHAQSLEFDNVWMV